MTKKITRKIAMYFICVAVVVATLPFNIISLAINFPLEAKISSKSGGSTGSTSAAYIFSKAGTKGHEADKSGTSVKVAELANGTKVILTAIEADGDGDQWYKISYGQNFTSTGYVYYSRITVTQQYEPDADFENWLNIQGFPESYKTGLRYLHMINPSWAFYADKVNLEWSDAVRAESQYGVKVVPGNSDDSWKSMDGYAYDWENNRYRPVDSGGWVTASYNVVGYYMDPRNFFDPTSIFMFADQSFTDGTCTTEAVQSSVAGTFMDSVVPDPNETRTYSQVLMEAGANAGVNPCVLSAMILQEQGTRGQGGCISGTIAGYEGLYNYFNIGAYAHSGRNAVQNGVKWAGGGGDTSFNRPWNTRVRAIIGGALWYSQYYVKAGQDTMYYKDFNVKSSKPYTHQYATNVKDAVDKGSFLSKAYSYMGNATVIFKIPIFNNMPEKTELPIPATNDNNYLSSLTVKGYVLQQFDKNKLDYELIVPENVESIEISATPDFSGAKVEGTGVISLSPGNNAVNIVVTATNGSVRTYTITISRQTGGDTPSTPIIQTNYKIDGVITGVNPSTDINLFKSNISVLSGSLKVTANNGEEKTVGNIATGDVIIVYDADGKEYLTSTVVIHGDVNGDGIIDIVDLARIKMKLLGVSEINGVYVTAADLYSDDKIDISDLARIKMHLLGVSNIIQ